LWITCKLVFLACLPCSGNADCTGLVVCDAWTKDAFSRTFFIANLPAVAEVVGDLGCATKMSAREI